MSSLTYDMLKSIVQSGANIDLDTKACTYDLLRELAQIAKASGSHLTMQTKPLTYDLIKELCSIAPNQITFTDYQTD